MSFFFPSPSQSQSLAEKIQLLTQKNVDPKDFVSRLNEKELPVGFALVEPLKFKAIHGEIPLTVKELEEIRKQILDRIKSSKTISFEKRDTLTQQVPTQEFDFDGAKIKVPPFFTLPEGLIITKFFPVGEVGNLLPEIGVDFSTPDPPVKASLFLDGKGVGTYAEIEHRLRFSPELTASACLSIGTHTVKISLVDRAGNKTENRWNFTVGIGDYPDDPLPEGSKELAQFEIPLKHFHPGSNFANPVFIKYFVTPQGEKRFVYFIGSKTGSFKTGSLALFRQRTRNGFRDNPDLTLFPQSPFAFEGNRIHFAYRYSGAGTIVKSEWKVDNRLGSQIVIGDEADYPLLGFVGGELNLTFATPNPSYPKNPAFFIITGRVSVWPPPIYCFIWNEYGGILTQSGTGTVIIRGARSAIWPGDIDYTPIIEGKVYSFKEKGKFKATKSRWKIIKNDSDAVIETLTATATQILFGKPGIVELIHEVGGEISWGDEFYQGEIPLPDDKHKVGLFGVQKFTALTHFKKFPSALIPPTTRKIQLTKIEFESIGQKREVVADGKIVPPIVFAHSTLFPEKKPLQAEYLIFQNQARTKNGIISLKRFDADFQTEITDPDVKSTVEAIHFQTLFVPYMDVPWEKKGKNRADSLFQPLFDWKPLSSIPANLVVKIDWDPGEPLLECHFSPNSTTPSRQKPTKFSHLNQPAPR